MKENMKKIVKRMSVIAIATAVIFGSVAVNPIKAEAKGTAFIKKKVSSVTPTIKSAKRSKGKTTIKVSVPTSKVKKLGSVKKATIAYGSSNGRRFEGKKAYVRPGKKVKLIDKTTGKPYYMLEGKTNATIVKTGKNVYTITLDNTELLRLKNAYITVKFDGKSNYSKLVKVSGKATKPSYKMPKRDKDGTYTKSIRKRFHQGSGEGSRILGGTLGAWDDGDGWLYITVQCGECMGCHEKTFDFVRANADSRDSTAHAECGGNCVGTLVAIAFDKKTGKVVYGNDCVLERFPKGTFFMEVE